MVDALGVKPGDIVCDMGCGNGFYTLKLAKLVGKNGKVIAVDIQREMLGLLDDRAKQENATNIETVLGTVADPKLPEKSLDLVLLVDVYHEFSHPEQMLASIRKSLKPTGRVASSTCREPMSAATRTSRPRGRRHQIPEARISGLCPQMAVTSIT